MPKTAAVTVNVAGIEPVKAMLAAAAAEHAALHRYLAGILRDGQHRAPTVPEYQDLVSTHDEVCSLMEDE